MFPNRLRKRGQQLAAPAQPGGCTPCLSHFRSLFFCVAFLPFSFLRFFLFSLSFSFILLRSFQKQMFKSCFHLRPFPTSTTSKKDSDLELGEREKLTPQDEKHCQRKFYDFCFPEDVWRHIIQYLTFLQLANLAEVNDFFYSVCTPLIENYKIKSPHILIKLEKDKLKINEIEICITGLSLDKIGEILRLELCNGDLFPTKELVLGKFTGA